jgi:hypothetical protein
MPESSAIRAPRCSIGRVTTRSLDENLPQRLVAVLAGLGHDVDTVSFTA